MKKSLFLLGSLISLFICTNIFAQEAENKIDFDTDFINTSEKATYTEWTGGYSPEEINTVNQIKDIGRRLGKGIVYQEKVEGDSYPYNKGNPAYKYSAARIYGLENRGADIILIGKTATVDTIKCLKMILRGYLETTFGYDDFESRKIAENICYWNTSKYNNFDYFNSNFEKDVVTAFEGRFKNIGLSESYTDWKESILIIPHTFISKTNSESEITFESPLIDEKEVSQGQEEPSGEIQPEQQEITPYANTSTSSNSYNSYNNNDNSRNSYSQIQQRKSYSSYNDKKSGSSDLKLLLIAGGAVLLIVIILVIIILRNK